MSQLSTEPSQQAGWSDDGLSGRWPTLVALLGTLLVHGLLLWILPDQLMPMGDFRERAAQPPEYEISLIEPAPPRYVEANPEVPENQPDRTEQYSFRAQQAADESVQDDRADAPQLDGEFDSQKIIQGSLEQSPPIEPGVYFAQRSEGEGEGEAGRSSEAEQPMPAQPLPAPDFIQQMATSEEGPGSRLEPVDEAPELADQLNPEASINIFRPPSDSTTQINVVEGGGGSMDREATPRPRPRLAPELVTGPLMRSERSASRRGQLAIDATFSEFGEYEQQFYAAVQTGWYQEIEFFQPIDTAARVHVRFTLHADGRVTDVQTVQSSASEIATFICENAISKRSPFRPWTREMVQVFGDERTLNVVFHYL